MRIANNKDIPAMKLILKALDNPWNPAALEDCFGHNYLQWVIEDNKKIIGFLTVHTSPDQWEIMFIAIDPSYQKKNWATKLLEYAILNAKKSEVKLVQLEVRKSNLAAIRLYQKLNFKQVGLRKEYYTNENHKEDALLFNLNL